LYSMKLKSLNPSKFKNVTILLIACWFMLFLTLLNFRYLLTNLYWT
jgi:hypothetical protein